MNRFINSLRIPAIALLALFVFPESLWASNPDDVDLKIINPAGPPEQIEYYDRCVGDILHSFIQEDFANVLTINNTIPVLTEIVKGWDQLTFEASMYYRYFFVTQSHCILSEKHKTKPKIQRQYLEACSKFLAPYFTFLKNAQGTKELPTDTQNRIILFRQGIITACAVVKISLCELATDNESRQMCKEAIDANRESVKYLKLVNDIAGLHRGKIKHILPVEMYNLVQLYCNYAILSKSTEPLSHARTLRDELKGMHTGMHDKAKKLVDLTSNRMAISQKSAIKSSKKTPSHLGPRTKQIKAAKAQAERRGVNKQLADISEEIDQMPIKIKSFNQEIRDRYINILHLDFDSPNVWSELEARLNDIEKRIYTALELEGPLDAKNLEKIYQCFTQLIPDDLWLKSLPRNLAGLTEVGNVDGAILRLGIVKGIQKEKLGNATRLTCMFFAYLQTLNGNYEDWLAFENEQTEEKKRIAAAIATRDAAAKAKYMEKMKASQVLSLEKPASSVASTILKSPKTPSSDKGKEEAYEYNDEPVINPAEEKRKKLERHTKNQEHKNAQSNTATEGINSPLASRSAPKLIEPVENDDDEQAISLIDIYGLTGVARQVDLKIFQGNWDITREELTAYFEALGCTHKPGGRGSHAKIQLNASVHVEKDSEILTIIVGGGGALTLPAWDKGYIKSYLKKQVLEGRKKLYRKAIQVKQEQEL